MCLESVIKISHLNVLAFDLSFNKLNINNFLLAFMLVLKVLEIKLFLK